MVEVDVLNVHIAREWVIPHRYQILYMDGIHFVLLIPHCPFNLIYLNQLTRSLNCGLHW